MDSNAISTAAVGMDTSNLQTPIITVWVIMTVLATFTVGLRFYTRRLILCILGPEDWLILVSMVLSAGTCVGFVRQTFYGLGRHIWTLNPEMIMQWKIEQFYGFLFYTMSLAFAKLSIVFLYLRVMVHGPQRIANYVLLAIIVACNIWVFINNFIQCIPLESLWNPAVEGTCLGLAVSIGNSVLHIVTEFLIFVLPIPTLLKLKINKKQKIGLMLVFSLGFFVCLISIIRLVIISRLSFDDPPYQLATVAYWGAVEVNLAIICACLTTLKPLIARLFPKLLGGSTASRYGTTRNAAPTASDGIKRMSTRLMTVEEREFARLEDVESVKSEQGLVAGYKMGGLAEPGRVYRK